MGPYLVARSMFGFEFGAFTYLIHVKLYPHLPFRSRILIFVADLQICPQTNSQTLNKAIPLELHKLNKDYLNHSGTTAE